MDRQIGRRQVQCSVQAKVIDKERNGQVGYTSRKEKDIGRQVGSFAFAGHNPNERERSSRSSSCATPKNMKNNFSRKTTSSTYRTHLHTRHVSSLTLPTSLFLPPSLCCLHAMSRQIYQERFHLSQLYQETGSNFQQKIVFAGQLPKRSCCHKWSASQ